MSLKRFNLQDLQNPLFKPLIFQPNDQFLHSRSVSAHNIATYRNNKRIEIDPKTKTLQQAKK
jgi:hypothetical protein